VHIVQRKSRPRSKQPAEGPRFRITTWPGGLIPVPPIPPAKVHLGDTIYLRFVMEEQPQEPPEELFLREVLDRQPDDPATLVEFTRSWGALTGWGERAWWLLPPEAEMPELRQAILKDVRRYAKSTGQNEGFIVRLDVVETHLRALRAMARHWIAWRSDTGPHSVIDAWVSETGLLVQSEAQAWLCLYRYLNAGLVPFHPRVHLTLDDTPLVSEATQPNLYAAVCLQLANAIADQTTTRICANVNCGRLFIRQRGRSSYNQHRSDAIYCSPQCARAVAARQWRRRNRSDRGVG
jgi:hypothetical protein